MRSSEQRRNGRGFSIRRPAFVVGLISLAVRVPVVVLVAVFRDGVLFRDDAVYLRLMGQWTGGETALWSESDRALWASNRNFLLPGAWLYQAFGTHPIFPLLLAALAGTLVVCLVTYVLSRHVNSVWALAGGVTLAVFPSQILWSSVVLKDVFVWLSTATLAALLTWWHGRRTWMATAAVCVGALLVFAYLADIRRQAMLGALLALAGAAIVAAGRWRLLVLGGLVGVLAVVPVAAGLGPFGWDLIRNGTAGREEVLAGALEDGRTSIACVIVPFMEPAPADGAGWAADLKCLPSGVRTLVLDPFPNQLYRSRSLWPAFAEHALWYPLLVLAGVGLLTTIRRRTWTPALVYTGLVACASVGMWGLVERNFGTAYRHRGEFVWCVVVFAAIGGQHLWQRRRQPSPSAGASGSGSGGASNAANPSTAD